MLKRSLINFCNTWKMIVYPLWDTELQRNTWFQDEEDDFNSFEEATGELIQRYLDDMQLPERYPFYQNEAGKLIKELYHKVHRYTTDSQSLDNSVIKEKFFADPDWVSIVALAKDVDNVLSEQIREVESGDTA